MEVQMLRKNRFDYTTQQPHGICILFSFAKAFDALTNKKISFEDVLKYQYQFTQNHLHRPVKAFDSWNALISPLLDSWGLFFKTFGASMDITDLNNDYCAKHLFPYILELHEDIGISCSHPIDYNVNLVKDREAAICYPFHHGSGSRIPCHVVVVAYEDSEYVVDPNFGYNYPFKALPKHPSYKNGFNTGGGDCILLEISSS